MKELLAEFMPRFVTAARDRLERSRTLLSGGQYRELERELHTLAGDAAMLGLPELAEMVRECEIAARRGAEISGEMPAMLDRLADAVEAAAAEHG